MSSKYGYLHVNLKGKHFSMKTVTHNYDLFLKVLTYDLTAKRKLMVRLQ